MALSELDIYLMDASIDHELQLLRLTASEQKTAIKTLNSLKIELKNKLNNDLTSFQKSRTTKLLTQTNTIIDSYYTQIANAVDFAELIDYEASSTVKTFAGIGLDISLPTTAALKALSSDVLFTGLPLSDWWDRQNDGLKRSFSSQVRLGIAGNETQQQIINRVFGTTTIPGIGFPETTLRRNISTMVHDTIAQITNDTRMAVYKQNDDITTGYYQLSTFDSHISKICMAYSGQEWDLDYNPINEPFLRYDGGCPRHPNCRSLILVRLKSYKELGYPEIKEPLPGTRASDLGQIDAGTDFDSFLGRHTVEYQNKMLGVGRAQLWRDGHITLSDLVSGNGRSLTLKELTAK